jgi:hypothetical protein
MGGSERVETSAPPLTKEQLYVPPHVRKDILRDIPNRQGIELNVSSNQTALPTVDKPMSNIDIEGIQRVVPD